MSEYQPTYIPFSPEPAPTSPLNEGSNLPVTNGTNFKVNVNRNKTRRWVNARAFTYDGDDWGDDDSDDDDDDDESKLRQAEEQAKQQKEREEEDYRRRFNSIQRRLGRQTSDKALPSLITNYEPAAGLKRSSGLQEPGKRMSLLQSPISAPAGPAAASSSSPGKGSSPSKSPAHEGRAPTIRPVDIYQRMEDDRLKQQKEQQQTAPSPRQEPVSAPAEAPTQVQQQDDAQGQQRMSVHGRQQQVPRLEINTRDASSHSNTSSSPSSKPAQRVIRVSPPTEVHPVSGSAQPGQQPQLRRSTSISRRAVPSSPEAPQAQQKQQQEQQQQQQPSSPTKSPLHTSGSRGFRSVVHQAFDASTPDASTPPESATRPINPSRPGTRSDSTKSLLSPILPSGAFPQTSSISATLAMGGPISEEPENVDGGGNGYGFPTSPKQPGVRLVSPVSPVPSVKVGHRRKMDPPDTQPGAERRTVVRESLVRMCSIPAEYGFAGDENEKTGASSSNDVSSTQQQQQQPQQGQQGEKTGDDSKDQSLSPASRGRQLSQQNSIPEGQSITAETSPAALNRISTLDQCVLDINKYIEQNETVAQRLLEANTDDEDERDAEHGLSGLSGGPATSLSAPFSPQLPPRSPLRSPRSPAAKDTKTDPHTPPSLKLVTGSPDMHPIPQPTVSLATPTPATPHDDEHDEEQGEHSPYAMSLAAQQNAQLENEIMLSLTPKHGMTPLSGRSNSNASTVSDMRLAAGVEPSSSPNWKLASSAENKVDESGDEKAAAGERGMLSPVHEHEQEPASTSQGSQSTTAASPGTTAADASQPKTFSTILSSARIWGGNRQSQGPEAQTGFSQSPIAEAEEAVQQPQPQQQQQQQQPSPTMLTSPTHDVADKRKSLVLTELPDGLGYVEKVRPQLSHKFSWEMDDSYVVPEEPPPASASASLPTQPQTLPDTSEPSTLATMNAVHSESPQSIGPLQTSALPPGSRGSDSGKGASFTPTITHISQELPHRPASPQGSGPGHLRQRPSGQLLASLNTTNLSRTPTVQSSAPSVDESTGTAERSDFSFLPSRTNTPPALPPRQQSPTTSVHDWQFVSPLSPRPRTAQTSQSAAPATPTAGSAIILSPTRSVSSLRARDPNLKSFRSIMALKSNTKRIEAFQYAREEAARVDMGLDSWIQATLAANPEHADLVSSTGAGLLGVKKSHMPQRNLSARTFDRIATSSHVRQISGGGLAHLVHSQQVHVKGKDLLHSAGGAAKGLFSRGKHRFRHGVSAEAN